MATTRSICPLDLEHILQYSITGWCPGCLDETSQLLSLLKDGLMNKVAVTKTKATLVTFPRFVKVHLTYRAEYCLKSDTSTNTGTLKVILIPVGYLI